MELSNYNRALLFKLLCNATKQNTEHSDLMAELGQQVPDELKPFCSRMDGLIKKGTNISLAGQKTGLWGTSERKAISKAIESKQLVNTFKKLAYRYQARVYKKSTVQYLLPFFLFLIFAALAAPLPDFLYGSQDLLAFILKAALPIICILIVIKLLSLPTSLLEKKWAKEFGLPRLFMKLPVIGQKHIDHEMGNYLEWCGIYRISGYEWINAATEAAKEVSNPVISDELNTIVERIKHHDTPYDAIAACRYFPEQLTGELVKAGKSNKLGSYLITFNAKRAIRDSSDLQHLTRTPRTLITTLAIALYLYAIFQYALLKGVL